MPLFKLAWGETDHRDLRAFLFQWSARIADALNQQLPKVERRFLAEMACRTQLKTTELVGSFEHGPPTVYTPEGRETSERYPAFEPPPAMFTVPSQFTDRIGVNFIDHLEGRDVVAAIQFVCPDHKADSNAALGFAVRAAELMLSGTGVVIVDIAPGPPSWATHLHSLTGVYPLAQRPRGGECPTLVVHPRFQNRTTQFDVWHHLVSPGEALPTVPVPVCGAMYLKLDLEATYMEACERSRIPG
jgi:hypothetical protein